MKLLSRVECPEPAAAQTSYRFFPGWIMVAIAAMANCMSAPGQSYSVAVFKDPMRESLRISETQFSLAYAFATIVSGMLLPIVGRIIDRYGARRMLPAITFLLGIGCLGMSQVGELAGLYLGFSVVRSLGQGAMSLISIWMVGEWFARRRGFATALSGLGGSISVMIVPLVNIYVITHFNWQTAWQVLAFSVWGILLLPSLLLVRNRPEDLGLLPDGDQQPIDSTTDQADANDVIEHGNWKLSAVLRDPTFWKLLAVPATSGMVGTGLVFHAVSLLGSRGISESWAVALISFQAIVATMAALGAGWLTDRCRPRHLLSTAMLLLALSSVVVLFMPWTFMAVIYAVLLGLHGSIIRSAGMVVWMTYYGREYQGAIRGIAMAAMILAAAAGPLPLALSIDWYGSYDLALYLFIAVPLVAAALVWSASDPRVAESAQ